MKIKAIRSLGKGLPDLLENEVAEVDDAIGKQLVKSGLAEVIEEKKPVEKKPEKPQEVKAVPKPVETSAKPVDIKATKRIEPKK